MIDRRGVFGLAAAGFALPALVRAQGAPQFTFRLHSFSSPTALDHTMHLDRWAERIGAASNGRIKVEVYPAMQLGGQPRDLVQQLEDGVVDMIWTVPGFTPGRFMGVEGLELPFMNTGLSVSESPAAFNFVQKHLAENEFRGIKIIAINATDRALVHTTRKPIRTLEDWRGLRIRVAGRWIGEAVTALGGTPVGIALPGVYEALARGQVDGMMINWAITQPFRFYEVAKFHSQPRGGIFQGMILTLMNQRSYNRLPADLKSVIDADSGAPLSARLGEIWDSQTQGAIDATKASAGNEIIDIPDAEKTRWRTAVQPVYDAWIAEMTRRGRNGRAMFEDIQAIAASARS